MTEQELLEAYPLLNDKDFSIAKRSICNLIGKDDLTDDRGHLTEYFNDTADNNDEMFFYEMLRALEFILEGATAYTTKDKRICLNYPNEDIVPMDNARFRRWYFVFCHECLHQLWDTFEVGDQIKKDLGSCDYQLLNIASDCVINEYLTRVASDGKLPPINGITAKYIEDTYGVKYSMKTDTQYSLYCKLNELSDAAKDQLKQQDQDQQGNGQSGQSQQGQQDQQGQNGQSGQSNQDGQGQQGSNGDSSNNKDKSGNNSSGSSAANAKKKLDEAQEKLDNGDIEGAKRLTKEVKDDLSKEAGKLSKEGKEKLDGVNGKDPQKDIADLNSVADEIANNSEGEGEDQGNQNKDNQDGQGQQGQGKDDGQSGGSGQGGTGDGNLIDRQLIEENKAAIEKICKKYAQSMSGSLGDFLKKCKSSSNLEEGGLLINAQRGGAHWNKQLLLECDQYIHQKLRSQDKKYKRSFRKIRRGERAFTAQDFNDGRTLKKGKVEIKDQIGFDMALYIDVSGSMCGVIDKVFESAYDIINTLKKTYSHDKLVDADAINMKSYVFTTTMREIPFGKKCRADGGTYEFGQLLDDIYKRNANAFLNIVITDGDFASIDKSKITKTLEDMDGLFVVVSNKPKGYFSDLVNHVKHTIGPKLVDIYADANFTID